MELCTYLLSKLFEEENKQSKKKVSPLRRIPYEIEYSISYKCLPYFQRPLYSRQFQTNVWGKGVLACDILLSQVVLEVKVILYYVLFTNWKKKCAN